MASRAGISNKNKAFLLNRLKDMFGDDFDPIVKSAINATRMQQLADGMQEDPEADEFTARKECSVAWDRIAQYVEPKLKAVEVSGVVASISHEEWLETLGD